MSPTTKKSVIPTAVKIAELLYPDIAMATSKLIKIVKTIKMGKPYFLNVCMQQAIMHETAIVSTIMMIIAGKFTKACLNQGLLYPQAPIPAVVSN